MIKATQPASAKAAITAVCSSTIALKGLLPIKEHDTADSCLTVLKASNVSQIIVKPAKSMLLGQALIGNTSLQNKMATTATLAMRHKISIDLHDSTVPPYIGLKLGLEALRRKIPEGSAIAAQVDELVLMAAESITELRQYIGELKSQIQSPFGKSLVDALLELAKKYQLRHGIKVIVNTDTKLKLSEHLSTEIYRLVCEGLSNIHRHTLAKQAKINVYYKNDHLVVEVINLHDKAKEFIHFTPRSMAERANCLGGTIHVHHTTDHEIAGSKAQPGSAVRAKALTRRTIVTAEIPLQSIERHCAPFA